MSNLEKLISNETYKLTKICQIFKEALEVIVAGAHEYNRCDVSTAEYALKEAEKLARGE